ncbi:MAG TPA: serine protease [Rhodanobacteraceae bacterium]|jgi:S1-C subfamily serine protease
MKTAMAVPSFARTTKCLAGLAFCALAFPAIAQTPPEPPLLPAPPTMSAAAESIYASTRPGLLQIRTLVEAAGRQSSIGSGFLVSSDGLAVTNYHVVSQFALEPKTYRLEFARPDGTSGPLKLLAIDVANDVAIVKLDGADLPHLDFDEAALADKSPRGERLYAMGNPLDLGFTIVEGTYNGFVERSYNQRVHFTGAINPGMSGGPAVTGAGRVAGINVAKRLDGELVSFLVPAAKAAALLERAKNEAPLDLTHVRDEIDRQLLVWQADFYHALGEQGFRDATLGPYQAPESAAPWFNCWARTNADQTPKPRAQLDSTSCSTQSSLYIAEDIETGRAELSHAYVRSVDLNPFQFAAFVSQYYGSAGMIRSWSRKRLTQPECHEDFVVRGEGTASSGPILRTVWCARAYRDFAGIYDVAITTVTQDRDKEALISRLAMQGVSYDNAITLAQRFVGELAWAK